MADSDSFDEYEQSLVKCAKHTAVLSLPLVCLPKLLLHFLFTWLMSCILQQHDCTLSSYALRCPFILVFTITSPINNGQLCSFLL
jgi:hypothetical protein